MLSLDDMRRLRSAYDPYSGVSEADALREIGNPTREAIVDAALELLRSEDRNVRVLMLRVLGGQSGDKAVRGILTGLNDGKRRVREVAVKSSGNYREHPAVAARLKAIVMDEGEKSRIRRFALDMLTGAIGSTHSDLTGAAADALRSLAQVPKLRLGILFHLLRLDLNDTVEGLLREFVTEGSKEEALMATRALCGYRVTHIGAFESAPEIQSHIRQTCEVASGRAYYWMKREDYDARRRQLEAARGR
jgi:hypothetical protein